MTLDPAEPMDEDAAPDLPGPAEPGTLEPEGDEPVESEAPVEPAAPAAPRPDYIDDRPGRDPGELVLAMSPRQIIGGFALLAGLILLLRRRRSKD